VEIKKDLGELALNLILNEELEKRACGFLDIRRINDLGGITFGDYN
jgi:hypothetical protein